MLNACEIDKQRVQVILFDNVKNMRKNNDDMAVPSVSCVSHTLQLVVLEGLLSQCSVTHSPANTRKVGANVVIACRIRKNHMKVHTLFQQNKKNYLGTAWMQVLLS